METLLIATTSEGKLREIVPWLADLPLVLVTLADYRLIRPPEETGRTFAENARLKARFYAETTGLLTVAEDSGLEIDALDGGPGVESARWGGPDATYPDKFSLIYGSLRARGVAGSSARFVCAVALAAPEPPLGTPGASQTHREPTPTPGAGTTETGVLFEMRGTVEGQIAAEPKGDGGFGYDPIFYYPPFGCTMAEAGARKSSVSHRAAAFRALRAFLEQRLKPGTTSVPA